MAKSKKKYPENLIRAIHNCIYKGFNINEAEIEEETQRVLKLTGLSELLEDLISSKLNEKQQKMIDLRYKQNLTFKEAAEAYGCSKTTITDHTSRATYKLARYWGRAIDTLIKNNQLDEARSIPSPMHVELITHTPEPEKIIATAARLCYSSSDINTLMDGLTDEKIESFLNMLTSMGHESPLEHITFTFGIEGVSRSLLAQITRHRIASFSVQSQRYVEETNFEFVTPPEIASDREMFDVYQQQMQSAIDSYNKLADMLKEKHKQSFLNDGLSEKEAEKKAQKKAIEDARFVLPNACTTKMIVTMNARSLLNFFNLRCCNRAQWEIRALAEKMLGCIYPIAPTIFRNAGPGCVSCGKCPEGKMTCGKAKEVIEKYKKIKNI